MILFVILPTLDLVFGATDDHSISGAPSAPGELPVAAGMLANYGTLTLEQVLTPAMQLAAGYPMGVIAGGAIASSLLETPCKSVRSPLKIIACQRERRQEEKN